MLMVLPERDDGSFPTKYPAEIESFISYYFPRDATLIKNITT